MCASKSVYLFKSTYFLKVYIQICLRTLYFETDVKRLLSNELNMKRLSSQFLHEDYAYFTSSETFPHLESCVYSIAQKMLFQTSFNLFYKVTIYNSISTNQDTSSCFLVSANIYHKIKIKMFPQIKFIDKFYI